MAGVPADRLEQRTEPAQSVLAQQTILAEHQGRILHLGEAGGEVVVPEQGHLLAERMTALEHAVEPPTAELLAVLRRRRRRCGRHRPEFPEPPWRRAFPGKEGRECLEDRGARPREDPRDWTRRPRGGKGGPPTCVPRGRRPSAARAARPRRGRSGPASGASRSLLHLGYHFAATCRTQSERAE